MRPRRPGILCSLSETHCGWREQIMSGPAQLRCVRCGESLLDVMAQACPRCGLPISVTLGAQPGTLPATFETQSVGGTPPANPGVSSAEIGSEGLRAAPLSSPPASPFATPSAPPYGSYAVGGPVT